MATDISATLNKYARIIGGGNANNNFGGQITASTSDGPRNGLLEFSIPSGSGSITQVTFHAYIGYNYGTTGDFPIHQLTRSNWTQSGVTYNKYDGTNSWTSAGGDYGTAMKTISVLGSASVGTKVSWDIMGGSADVPITVNWSDTLELIIRSTTAGAGLDIDCTTNLPYIEITYTSGGGGPTAMPRMALLGVGQ